MNFAISNLRVRARYRLYWRLRTPGFRRSFENLAMNVEMILATRKSQRIASENLKTTRKLRENSRVFRFYVKKNGPDIGTIKRYDLELRLILKLLMPCRCPRITTNSLGAMEAIYDRKTRALPKKKVFLRKTRLFTHFQKNQREYELKFCLKEAYVINKVSLAGKLARPGGRTPRTPPKRWRAFLFKKKNYLFT